MSFRRPRLQVQHEPEQAQGVESRRLNDVSNEVQNQLKIKMGKIAQMLRDMRVMKEG